MIHQSIFSVPQKCKIKYKISFAIITINRTWANVRNIKNATTTRPKNSNRTQQTKQKQVQNKSCWNKSVEINMSRTNQKNMCTVKGKSKQKWLKMNIATSSRTFFFMDRSLFVYGRHRIRLCCLDCTHWQGFFRQIDFVFVFRSLIARVRPYELYSIFCAQFWYCFSEQSVRLTRLQYER